MSVNHPPAITIAALEDILAQAKAAGALDTSILWVNIGEHQIRPLTDEWFVVPEEDAEFGCDIVIGSRVEAWYDVIAERAAS
jgi:hypothetical protein